MESCFCVRVEDGEVPTRGEVEGEFVRDEAGASASQLLPAQRWEAASRLDV